MTLHCIENCPDFDLAYLSLMGVLTTKHNITYNTYTQKVEYISYFKLTLEIHRLPYVSYVLSIVGTKLISLKA